MNFITESKQVLSKNRNIRIIVSSNFRDFKIISPTPLDKEVKNVLKNYGRYVVPMINSVYEDLIFFNDYYKTIPENTENMSTVRLLNIISSRIEDCVKKLKIVFDIHLLNNSEICIVEKESSFYIISRIFRV